MGSGITEALGKVAGAFGVAMTAVEAFNKIIESSDALDDYYKSTMEEVTASVNTFFDALAHGNFRSFITDLQNATKSAREAYNALDDLETTKTFNKIRLAELQESYEKMLLASRNRNISEKERLVYLNNAKAIMAQQVVLLNQQIRQQAVLAKAKYNQALSEAGLSSLAGNEKMQQWYRNHQDVLQQRATQWQKRNDNYNIQLGNENIQTPSGAVLHTPKYYKVLKQKEQWENSSAYGRGERAYKYVDMMSRNPDALQQGDQATLDILELQKQMEQMDFQLNNSEARITGGFNKKKSKNKVIYPEGSVGWYDKQISTLETKLSLTVDPASYKAIQSQIDALTAKKQYIEIVAKNEKSNGLGVNANSKFQMPDISDDWSKKQKAAFQKYQSDVMKSVTRTQKFANSLSQVGNVMSSLGSISHNSFGKIVSMMGQLLSTTAEIIPIIQALTMSQESYNAAKKVGAITAAAESAAETPIIGWLEVGAAVAATVAALASAGAYATGGIVGGSSYSGDNILARVNSGEMILNGAQQKNLFSMLNNNSTNGSTNVSFTIKGKDLVGVMNNYNSKMNRIK